MNRKHVFIFLGCALLGASGCSTTATRLQERPSGVAALTPDARSKIERGVVEPGFTPEMVYLALGKPASPVNPSIDATRDGVWVYREFHGNDRDFIRAGFRRRVIFDPERRSDVVITEPVDSRLFPNLQDHALYVTFRDGRVVDIQRTAI